MKYGHLHGSEGNDPGFETQGRHEQKYGTGLPVALQKELKYPKNSEYKNIVSERS